MTSKEAQYKYTVVDISEGDEVGYTAIIPKFPKLYVMADSIEELHEVVAIAIQEEEDRIC